MMRALFWMMWAVGFLEAQNHIIRVGTLLDGLGHSAAAQTIVVNAGKIVSVEAESSLRPDIDLSEETVMPGWIGACLNISDDDGVVRAESKAYRLLKMGFTTVVAGPSRTRELIEANWAGPRTVSRGDCGAAETLMGFAREHRPITQDVLTAVTSEAAERLRIGDRTGSIAVGMLADFVATRTNPLVDGGALREVVFVMKDGHMYREPESKRKKLIRRF